MGWFRALLKVYINTDPSLHQSPFSFDIDWSSLCVSDLALDWRWTRDRDFALALDFDSECFGFTLDGVCRVPICRLRRRISREPTTRNHGNEITPCLSTFILLLPSFIFILFHLNLLYDFLVDFGFLLCCLQPTPTPQKLSRVTGRLAWGRPGELLCRGELKYCDGR